MLRPCSEGILRLFKSVGWKECGIVGSNRALQGFELPFIQRRLLGDVLQTFTDCSLLEQVNRSSNFKAPPLDLGLLGPGLDSCSLSSWGADLGVSEAAVGPYRFQAYCRFLWVTRGLLG